MHVVAGGGETKDLIKSHYFYSRLGVDFSFSVSARSLLYPLPPGLSWTVRTAGWGPALG